MNEDFIQAQFIQELDAVIEEIREMLIEKNASYGDSALNPVRIFSRADAGEQIRVRIDDKLSRMARGTEYQGDNDEDDLLGYFLLLKIRKNREKGTQVPNGLNPIA